MAYSDAGSATLAATDLSQVLKGSSVDVDIAVEPIEIVAGGFDQYAAVPGKSTGKGTLKFAMNPASSNGQTLPQWGKVLQGSCDFALASTTAGGTVASNFSLTPISEATDAGILDHYTGSTSTNGALKSRFYNLKGSWKISMQANKVPTVDFSLDGAFHSEADGTQPDITSAKQRENPYSLKGATTLVLGSSVYKVTSFEFDGSEAVVNRDDPSQTNGAGQTDITDRKIKASIKCYAVTKATVDPLLALQNSTEGSISVAWGTGSKAITISGTYFQITERKKVDENGITAFDIKGQLNRNDFTVKIN